MSYVDIVAPRPNPQPSLTPAVATVTVASHGGDARGPAGIDAAFLAAGDYHHHISQTPGRAPAAPPPPPGHTGLRHVAFLHPTGASWAACR